MAALATVADVEARLGRELTVTEAGRVDALLADASAAIRAYTGQTFERAEVTRTWVYADALRRVRIRGRAVSDVAFENEEGDAVGAEQIAADLWRVDEVGPLTITYEAGYDVVPDLVVAVCCQMAARAFGATPEAAGIQMETTGPFSVQYGQVGASGGVGMLPAERDALAPYKLNGPRTVQVQPWAS